MMQPVYLSTAYLAPVQYYCKLFRFAPAYIETCENYVKQSYRNRCIIAGANGALTLTVPVEKPAAPKCLTRDIRISEHGRWRHLHWHALISAYQTSPFFEYYRDDFITFYEKKYVFLFDFNEALRRLVCELLDMQPDVRYTAAYVAGVPNDFRAAIRPRRPPPDPSFHPKPYYQVFRSRFGFLPNLSIVDLLFNMGAESLLILGNTPKPGCGLH